MKPIIYLYFHSKILNWKGKVVDIKDFKSSFFQWRIPKNLREPIMKEMQKLGLIRIDKRIVYIEDFYFEQKEGKQDYKDSDTRIESPYVNYKML
jgi:hypothetical protein